MKIRIVLLALGLVTMIAAPAAMAALSYSDLGVAAPPAFLGTYSMTAFGADPQSEYAWVSSVASPLGGAVSFSSTLEHLVVPTSWATWSHGYTGDVYYNPSTTITLTMPANTEAFYLYAEPNPFQLWQIKAIAQDGTDSGWQNVNGDSGARGYGFYGTVISSIQVQYNGDLGFAVGEFGIAPGQGGIIPAPAAAVLGLFGLGVIGWAKRRFH